MRRRIEGPQPEQPFAIYMQGLAAGAQKMGVGRPRQQMLNDLCHGIDHVFAIIQDEQEVFVADELNQLGLGAL